MGRELTRNFDQDGPPFGPPSTWDSWIELDANEPDMRKRMVMRAAIAEFAELCQRWLFWYMKKNENNI